MRLRTGRRALYLCVFAICLMGFSVGSAQGASWMVKGKDLVEGQLPSLTVRGHGTLLFSAAGVHVKILCTGYGMIGAHLIWGVIPYLLGSLRGTGCTITLNGALAKSCEPHTGAEKGVIVTNELEGPLTLVSGQGVTVLGPKKGETVITIETGEECAIGEKIPIIGKLAFKDSGGKSGLETEAKVHTVEEGPGTELWAFTKTEEHKTKFEGKFEEELTTGELWSGLPG